MVKTRAQLSPDRMRRSREMGGRGATSGGGIR
jgi:hypothetical protein